MSTSAKQSYSAPAVAERLGVGVAKVQGWIDSGELRGINVAEKRDGKRPRWRILAEDLEKFLESRAATPATPAPVKKPKRRQPAHVIQFFK